jgi:hypothetical protein
MSPQHMTEDPFFEVNPDTGYSAEARIDLSSQPTLSGCGVNFMDRQPNACGFNYCGKGAKCSLISGAVACECPAGMLGTRVTAPSGGTTVTCTPTSNPFAITSTAGGAGTMNDPCRNFSCGDGTCVLKGGFPLCECDTGAVATLRNNGTLGCEMTAPDAKTFGPGAGVEARPASTQMSALKKRSRTRSAGLPGVWMLALLLAAMGTARHILRKR